MSPAINYREECQRQFQEIQGRIEAARNISMSISRDDPQMAIKQLRVAKTQLAAARSSMTSIMRTVRAQTSAAAERVSYKPGFLDALRGTSHLRSKQREVAKHKARIERMDDQMLAQFRNLCSDVDSMMAQLDLAILELQKRLA
jgi:hypothetical protein